VPTKAAMLRPASSSPVVASRRNPQRLRRPWRDKGRRRWRANRATAWTQSLRFDPPHPSRRRRAGPDGARRSAARIETSFS
jgi:hypothetical protein